MVVQNHNKKSHFVYMVSQQVLDNNLTNRKIREITNVQISNQTFSVIFKHCENMLKIWELFRNSYKQWNS